MINAAEALKEAKAWIGPDKGRGGEQALLRLIEEQQAEINELRRQIDAQAPWRIYVS